MRNRLLALEWAQCDTLRAISSRQGSYFLWKRPPAATDAAPLKAASTPNRRLRRETLYQTRRQKRSRRTNNQGEFFF
jgi:hypothetical protein